MLSGERVGEGRGRGYSSVRLGSCCAISAVGVLTVGVLAVGVLAALAPSHTSSAMRCMNGRYVHSSNPHLVTHVTPRFPHVSHPHLVDTPFGSSQLVSDFLLAWLRQQRRGGRSGEPPSSHPKLILMSATLDAAFWQRYVGGSIIRVPGCTFPIRQLYLEHIYELLGETPPRGSMARFGHSPPHGRGGFLTARERLFARVAAAAAAAAAVAIIPVR